MRRRVFSRDRGYYTVPFKELDGAIPETELADYSRENDYMEYVVVETEDDAEEVRDPFALLDAPGPGASAV